MRTRHLAALLVAAGCGADAAPDLVAQSIRRDTYYYYVDYCNLGGSADPGAGFRVRWQRPATGNVYDSPSIYPYPVPEPGECTATGGVTCGLIDDPACDLDGLVFGLVDVDDTVAEADESNNGVFVDFERP